jgi:hypothetical protein
VFHLEKNPSRWTKIHALSRSKKDDCPHNVVHKSVDFTTDANVMAKAMSGVEADYVFFAAYLQQNSEKENWDVNGLDSQWAIYSTGSNGLRDDYQFAG